ncbi:MAG: competence/damage-inducible protein A [Flavobacteriaceae bacterium]|nr:competence/damage-inducible protein A [Flavobacteriaceae bacterium]MDZ4147570.1 competence/damage-inducible protein A [Flavobacteriaceae bacterium]
MRAEIITIGDEILIGQIVDTNSAFIAKELNKIGIEIFQITSVHDDSVHILQAFKNAENHAEIIIITGGLGPTKDDITKQTLCTYFDDVLIQDDAVLAHVEELFAKYINNTPISDLNRKQALIPSKAKVLKNAFGTAPGMWIEKNDKVFISLPGVPYEMKALIANEVVPRLLTHFKRPFILHKTVLTYGLGESVIAERIADWEDHLPAFIKLAYLPNLGKVRLRLSAKGSSLLEIEQEVSRQLALLMPKIADIYVGMEEDEEIEQSIGKLFAQKGKTLALAESCTGGKLASKFTANPGASKYFMGSVVSYATASKEDILKVPTQLINQYTVVSAEVAQSMATQAQKLFNSDYALSTTGNAGPAKGDSEAEVGTVFIALATPKGVFSEKFEFGKNRDRVIGKAVNKALEILFKEILKN